MTWGSTFALRCVERVAISNHRLVALDERGVTFRWKDFCAKARTRYETVTLGAHEFMRRFLLRALLGRFHRIRRYGLLASPGRRQNVETIRKLLHVTAAGGQAVATDDPSGNLPARFICWHCGVPMIIVHVLQRSAPVRASPAQRVAA